MLQDSGRLGASGDHEQLSQSAVGGVGTLREEMKDTLSEGRKEGNGDYPLTTLAHFPKEVSQRLRLSPIFSNFFPKIFPIKFSERRSHLPPGVGSLPRMASPRLLTEKEYAEMAKIPVRQVRKLIVAGRLRASDYGTGSHKLYRLEETARPIDVSPADSLPSYAMSRRRRPPLAGRIDLFS